MITSDDDRSHPCRSRDKWRHRTHHGRSAAEDRRHSAALSLFEFSTSSCLQHMRLRHSRILKKRPMLWDRLIFLKQCACDGSNVATRSFPRSTRTCPGSARTALCPAIFTLSCPHDQLATFSAFCGELATDSSSPTLRTRARGDQTQQTSCARCTGAYKAAWPKRIDFELRIRRNRSRASPCRSPMLHLFLN